MSTFYSGQGGQGLNSGVSIDDSRRMFDFGNRVAELAPQQSPFFVYLSKVAKKPTDDPVFKFLEQRHQWQRRNFEIKTADTLADAGAITANGTNTLAANEDLLLTAKYDQYGKISSGYSCDFIMPGDVIALEADDGVVYKFRVDPDTTLTTGTGTFSQTGTNKEMHHETDNALTTIVAEAVIPMQDVPENTVMSVGNKGQVIGSAFPEGGTAPEGWQDKMFDREGYCQIFKTAISTFSGTAMATSYRGIANEFKRVWAEKLMEHKMDLEQALLFSTGAASNEQSTTAPTRTTNGIVPYTESNGKVYNMSYASSGYDAFLDAMEDFFAPESGNSGNKLVLSSRKVITYLNKLGSGSFMNNSVGADQYRLDVNSIPGQFGHTVTKVSTIFGNLHFVQEPLLRGPWENYCVAVDMKNVAYRPLVGNGTNRDTHILTNVQNNDVDGRKDMILTEAGFEISVPETHAVLKFA